MDSRPCDLMAPFGDLRPVDGVVSAVDEGNPTLSPDELTMHFFSNRQSPGTADLDVYVATRSSRDAAFGAPGPVASVNTLGDERGGSVSADGRALFFHSSRTGEYDLYVATRPNTAAPFGAPASLGAGVNTAMEYEQQPFIAADSETLYFDRTPSGGTTAIYRASSSPTGFTNPVELTELSAAGSSSMRPIVSADGLTMFFSSDRPGGAGSLDIWTATRSSPSTPFGSVTNVTELNTSEFAFPDWISPDGCRIYFTSRRTGGMDWDIWVADRPKPTTSPPQ